MIDQEVFTWNEDAYITLHNNNKGCLVFQNDPKRRKWFSIESDECFNKALKYRDEHIQKSDRNCRFRPEYVENFLSCEEDLKYISIAYSASRNPVGFRVKYPVEVMKGGKSIKKQKVQRFPFSKYKFDVNESFIAAKNWRNKQAWFGK